MSGDIRHVRRYVQPYDESTFGLATEQNEVPTPEPAIDRPTPVIHDRHFPRPEPRRGWFGWLVAGLVFWPLLLGAIVRYNRDNNAYQAALLEYAQGGNPEWYWRGLDSSEPVSESAPHPERGTARKLLGILVMLALIPLIGFALMVLVALISTMTG